MIVTWWSGSGGIQVWSRRPPGLILPEMTYNVLSGTLSNQPTNERTNQPTITCSIRVKCTHLLNVWINMFYLGVVLIQHF